jgi:hypothetical protein
MCPKAILAKWRSGVATAMWLGATALLLASCGSSLASPSQVHADRHQQQTSSLLECVQKWNRATLGEGHFEASLDATVRRQSALMFSFPNGACGLAFSRRMTATGSRRQPLVNFESGDYPLAWSPLGLVSSPEQVKLNADASKRTNVVVNKSGRVVVRPHAHIFDVPFDVFKTPNCAHVVVVPVGPLNAQYEIVKTTVSCVAVRTLLWAWTSSQASKEQAHSPSSMVRASGWQCIGSEPIPGFTPVTDEKITCTSGGDIMEARNLLRQRYE